MSLSIEAIARVCHEANRAYCLELGDDSQPPWDEAPDWQKQSAAEGVKAVHLNPDRTPRESHEGWMDQKASDGWQWGPEKDAAKKTHPCMVPYDELPEDQRVKDELFTGIARALLFPLGAGPTA